ncbi:MAG: site-2 protease family protein [Anaerolineales bacterium]
MKLGHRVGGPPNYIPAWPSVVKQLERLHRCERPPGVALIMAHSVRIEKTAGGKRSKDPSVADSRERGKRGAESQRYNAFMLGLTLPDVIARVLTLLVAFTLHEYAHATVATRLGDSTPGYYGRLSLNPLRHLDPLGSLLLVAFGFGWAKPVPVNSNNLRPSPRAGMGIVSLAGPVTNVLLAFVGGLPFLLGLASPEFLPTTRVLPTPAFFLSQFVVLNIVLAVFNLIPLSPLDGEKVVGSLLQGEAARSFEQFQRWGPLVLLGLLFLLPLVGVDPISWVILGAVHIFFH